MTTAIDIAGDWGHALAAAAFAALAILALRRAGQGRAERMLVAALVLTALWALQTVIASVLAQPSHLAGGLAETLRNMGWVALLWFAASRQGIEGGEERPALPRGAAAVFIALILTFAMQVAVDVAIALTAGAPTAMRLLTASWLLRSVAAIAAIVLAHAVFGRLDRRQSARYGWLGLALTAMWAYDFHHYLLAWFSDGASSVQGQLRGLVMAALAPFMLVGSGAREPRGFTVSRRAAYHIATVGIGGLYALALLATVMLARTTGDPAIRIVQIGVVFGLSVGALILLPSARFRAWLRVEIAKHLFAHRYDYRAEWIGFAQAMSAAEGGSLPLDRSARAIAQAVSAPAALLYLRAEDGRLVPGGGWNWHDRSPHAELDAAIADRLEEDGWIADLANPLDPVAALLPNWIMNDRQRWALAPMMLRGTLLGAALIARPPGRGRIDWEDLDMLRVAGAQLAVTLSEQRQREALAEAERFDEFNRRFAFILHDIKNMLSQISLLAANAERHADNPAFRADMVLTLRETADRMNGLIARLARAEPPRGMRAAACDLGALARRIAARPGIVPVLVEGDGIPVIVGGDPERLAQAIAHLVQNAREATAPGGPPVRLVIGRDEGCGVLAICDRGAGMSAAFIAGGLFRPFTSTKQGGFGLGAHEARAIVTGMGGRLSVESREGEGTRFTLSLPMLPENASESFAERKTG